MTIEPDDLPALQQRTLRVVMASQVLGGAGLAAGVTVGALIAKDMVGGDGIAGVPMGLYTLGSALAAYLVGRTSQLRGRNIGLGIGFAAGSIGAVGVVVATALDSIVLLFAALFVYGAGTATNLQARYAGTDLARAAQRGRAISTAMVSTTFGAVAGPNLTGPTGRVAEWFGLPPLAGPFLLAAVAYGLAGLVLFVLLRPDPFLVARDLADRGLDPDGPFPHPAPAVDPTAHAATPDDPTDTLDERGTPVEQTVAPAIESTPVTDIDSPPTSIAPITEPTTPLRRAGLLGLAPGVLLGAGAMVATQTAMVAIMTMTPPHMQDHGHELGPVGLVIGFHIAGMYLPSPVTGFLVDRFGRGPMVIAAALTMLASGLVAAYAPGESLAAMIVALVLLGIGWNMGLISGTALVVDNTEIAERAGVQGGIEVAMAIAGAGGGALSGVVVAQSSFLVLSLAFGTLSLVLLPLLAWFRARDAAAAASAL